VVNKVSQKKDSYKNKTFMRRIHHNIDNYIEENFYDFVNGF